MVRERNSTLSIDTVIPVSVIFFGALLPWAFYWTEGFEMAVVGALAFLNAVVAAYVMT